MRVRRRAGDEEDDAANRIDAVGVGGLGALAEEKAALEAREGLADRVDGQQQQKGRKTYLICNRFFETKKIIIVFA